MTALTAPTIAEARAALAQVQAVMRGGMWGVDAALDQLVAFIDAAETREAELLEDVRALCAQRAALTDDANELCASLREVRARAETFAELRR